MRHRTKCAELETSLQFSQVFFEVILWVTKPNQRIFWLFRAYLIFLLKIWRNNDILLLFFEMDLKIWIRIPQAKSRRGSLCLICACLLAYGGPSTRRLRASSVFGGPSDDLAGLVMCENCGYIPHTHGRPHHVPVSQYCVSFA